MLDLNPEQARRYLKRLIDSGSLVEGNCRLDDATDEDLSRLAKQLFLFGDLETAEQEKIH